MTTTPDQRPYPARLEIARPERHDRLSTLFRLLLAIPILIILALATGSGGSEVVEVNGERELVSTGGSIAGSLAVATALMIAVRRRYPRWWFDFAQELSRFSARVGAYMALLTDRYPSTVEPQDVDLNYDYPDVERDLNRWLPLVKWLLALPHYLILAVLSLVAIVAVVIAWFAILLTERYPRSLFDFVVGVARWGVRVYAYAFLLATDRYPPFSLR